MSLFDEKKTSLLRYITKYVKKHLVEGEEFNTSKSGFGHDLNCFHYYGFRHELKYKEMYLFEQLHATVPVLLTYWKGDATMLVKWLEEASGPLSSGTLSMPPYSGINRDIWWNLYYALNNIKEREINN